MISAPTASAARLPAASTRRRNTHSGRTGSAARRSTSTNATSSTVPTAKIAEARGRPPGPARRRPRAGRGSAGEQPTVSSAAPG